MSTDDLYDDAPSYTVQQIADYASPDWREELTALREQLVALGDGLATYDTNGAQDTGLIVDEGGCTMTARAAVGVIDVDYLR